MPHFFLRKWKQVQEWMQIAIDQSMQRSMVEEKASLLPIRKILCVDNNPDFCLYIQRFAHALNFESDQAYSIEQAKDKIEEQSDYQALIIDGDFPDGSSFELIAWIRGKKNLQIPIGFISRIYMDAASFRILKEKLKVNYVLEKPLRPYEAGQLLRSLCQSEPNMNEGFSDDILPDLKANYQKTIFDKLERLEKMILSIQKHPSSTHLKTLKEEIHKIAGSSGSYGYLKVSELCKNLELELEMQMNSEYLGEFHRKWLASLDNFFTQIKLYFQFEQLEFSYSTRGNHSPSVFVVDEDRSFLDLFNEIPKHRFNILTEIRPELAHQRLLSSEFYPQIVLSNAHYQESSLTGYELIKAFWQNKDSSASVIGLLVEDNALESYVEAFQRGMTCVLSKALHLPLLILLLDQTPFRAFPLPYKILVIDSDPDIYLFILQEIKFIGLDIHYQTDVAKLNEKIADFQPDLILLDINLIDPSSLAALTQLRGGFGFQKLLVGMISDQEEHLMQQCYHAGVDEILFKPLEKRMLQTRIASLLKKEEVLSLTGFEDSQTFQVYLEKLQSRVSGNIAPKVLVMFEINDFIINQEEEFEQTLLAHMSEILGDLLKKHEMAAYLGQGRFELVFQGYEFPFVQLFMEAFLCRLQSHLESVWEDKKIQIKGTITPILPEETVDEAQRRVEQAMLLIEKFEEPVFLVLVEHGQPASFPKEVFVFHEEGGAIESLKNLFEKHDFTIHFCSPLEENFALFFKRGQRPLPLLIFLGTGGESKVFHLRRKLMLHHQVQLPIVYLSRLSDDEYLQKLLQGVDYFQSPFGLMILIGIFTE